MESIIITTGPGYSLAETCAPVAWGGGRWPNHDWIDNRLVSVIRDEVGPVIRVVYQDAADRIVIETDRPDADHEAWARAVLGTQRTPPPITDPVIAGIARRYPGMRPFSNGELFEGIVTAIIGQSISVQAAAVTERKLAALFADPIAIGNRSYWTYPKLDQIASSQPSTIRTCGVTQRRADAIVAIARLIKAGALPDPAGTTEAELYAAVLGLPQVGRWTAESVLLWGLGSDDSYPIGDVALLRAARRAYERPELTHKEMDALSNCWAPGRSWAARWLWLNLFGPAPVQDDRCGADAEPAG